MNEEKIKMRREFYYWPFSHRRAIAARLVEKALLLGKSHLYFFCCPNGEPHKSMPFDKKVKNIYIKKFNWAASNGGELQRAFIWVHDTMEDGHLVGYTRNLEFGFGSHGPDLEGDGYRNPFKFGLDRESYSELSLEQAHKVMEDHRIKINKYLRMGAYELAEWRMETSKRLSMIHNLAVWDAEAVERIKDEPDDFMYKRDWLQCAASFKGELALGGPDAAFGVLAYKSTNGESDPDFSSHFDGWYLSRWVANGGYDRMRDKYPDYNVLIIEKTWPSREHWPNIEDAVRSGAVTKHLGIKDKRDVLYR